METTKAQIAARLGAELPHSTVLDDIIPHKPHTPHKNVFLEAMEDVVFGSIAGIAGKFIEYPFDTVKVRLQSQPSPPLYTGPLDCFRQSFAHDGIRGLYRGIPAPLVGAALENSSLFVSEQCAQKLLFATGIYSSSAPLPLSALFLTGGAAGAVTSLVLTPVELVKCKMQVPHPGPSTSTSKPPPSILGIIRDVYRHNGLKGFWHGQMGTFIRETGGGAAWFGSKETVSALFRNYNTKHSHLAPEALAREKERPTPLPLWQQAVAGASAGMAYNFLFFPADTIKSRMQTAAISSADVKALEKSFWAEGRMLWRQTGLRGMYAGCGITVFRSAPSSAFVFIIYDGLKGYFAFA